MSLALNLTVLSSSRVPRKTNTLGMVLKRAFIRSLLLIDMKILRLTISCISLSMACFHVFVSVVSFVAVVRIGKVYMVRRSRHW